MPTTTQQCPQPCAGRHATDGARSGLGEQPGTQGREGSEGGGGEAGAEAPSSSAKEPGRVGISIVVVVFAGDDRRCSAFTPNESTWRGRRSAVPRACQDPMGCHRQGAERKRPGFGFSARGPDAGACDPRSDHGRRWEMGRVLSSLIALCPPPGPAVRVDWARAEEQLGVALPDDYKALAKAYGVGWFSEWLMVNLPDSSYPQFDLLHDLQDTEWHRSSRDHQPGTIPYAFHPEPSGLIRWGHTRTGDDFWWLPVTDSPRDWRIVASDHGVDWAEFDCTTTEFVHRLLTERLILAVSDRTPKILPFCDRRPHHRPEFHPMPVPPDADWDSDWDADSDWDPRPSALLRQPAPVATRDGWQAVIRAAAAVQAQPAAPPRHPRPSTRSQWTTWSCLPSTAPAATRALLWRQPGSCPSWAPVWPTGSARCAAASTSSPPTSTPNPAGCSPGASCQVVTSAAGIRPAATRPPGR
jgi:hypothetical protein